MFLRFWVQECQNDWAAYLPIAEFTHNNWPHETTRESPFYLLMGYNPHADWTTSTDLPFPQVAQRLDQFQLVQHRVQQLLI
jgi:hypothetical protein